MTDGGYALLVHRRLPGPSEAEHAELAQLRERFRSHHIFCDAPGDAGPVPGLQGGIGCPAAHDHHR